MAEVDELPTVFWIPPPSLADVADSRRGPIPPANMLK